MEYPNSPLIVLRELLSEYRSGARTPEEFRHSLVVFEEFLRQWSEGTLAVSNPSGDVAHDEYKDAVLECLDYFSEALACMHDYMESGDEALADQGLKLAETGNTGLGELMASTQQALEQLEDEIA